MPTRRHTTRKRASEILSELLGRDVGDPVLFQLEEIDILPRQRPGSRRPTRYTAAEIVRARCALELRGHGIYSGILRALIREMGEQVVDWGAPAVKEATGTFKGITNRSAV